MQGQCYCDAIRDEVTSKPGLKAQCDDREPKMVICLKASQPYILLPDGLAAFDKRPFRI